MRLDQQKSRTCACSFFIPLKKVNATLVARLVLRICFVGNEECSWFVWGARTGRAGLEDDDVSAYGQKLIVSVLTHERVTLLEGESIV
jgi:hypothetical protein